MTNTQLIASLLLGFLLFQSVVFFLLHITSDNGGSSELISFGGMGALLFLYLFVCFCFMVGYRIVVHEDFGNQVQERSK